MSAPTVSRPPIRATSTLPADKVLMPGFIAHSTDVVEHPELVAERLLRYTNIVGQSVPKLL
jgi:methionine synthase II (cobalamin-independent)